MKAFDIIFNHASGEKNPNKKFIFLRYSGRYIICVDFKGMEHRFYKNDEDKWLQKIGNILNNKEI
jgi:hypothetical protein